MKARMKNAAPAQKVWGATFGAAATTIIVWVLNTYFLPPRPPIPAEIQGAIATVVTFLVGYFIPPSASDEIEKVE